jgi:hypothetical protein
MTISSQNCLIGRLTAITLSLLLVCCTVSVCCAQGAAGDQRTELGIRQQLVKRKMVELEKKFMVVADRIREEKPQRAELLVKTYQKSKEESLTRKMDLVSELLNSKKNDEAEQQLDEVVGILESLIRLLTNEKEKEVSPRQEMETLERIKQKIQKQLEQQQKQTRETEKASNKDAAAEKVAAQIKALKGLIDKQAELIKETGGNAKSKLNQLDKLADKQFGVRKATDELNKNITGKKNSLNKDGSFKEMPKPLSGEIPRKRDQESKGPKEEASKGESSKPNESDDSGERFGGDKPAGDLGKSGREEKSEQKQEGGENSEGKSTEGKGAQQKGAQGNSGGKPQQGQPSDKGKSDPSSGEDGGQKSPEAPPQPGQKALEKAADHQKRAEEKLGSGKPTDAKQQQEQALDQMKDA